MPFEQFHQFLRERLAAADAILIGNVEIHNQEANAKILRAYSTNHSGPSPYSSGEISFVGSPRSWGNPTLRSNDKAIAFIGYLESSKRFYQYHWRAHFLIIDYGGQDYVLYQWNFNNSNWWPSEFHSECIVPFSDKPWQVAIPFPLFEKHLLLIAN